ncbi:MAG: serine--tRNA ligase [Bacteroidota bacterium]|nr:serine--tRNA ligase [Bacteroidota bacterium]MEC8097987.1 serine--tRNA ligase [Bacteroidota bacterium]
MISIPHLRENYDEILIAFKKRDFDAKNVIDNLLNEDKNRREIQAKLDNKLFESNQLTKEIGKLYKDGKTNEANKKKSLSLKIKNESKNLVEKLSNCEQSIKELQYKIPNIPNIRVPNGKSSTDNKIIFESNKKNKSSVGLTHWELAKKYNLISFDLGSKISGSGFPVYIGKGAKLQRALINYFIDFNTKEGYEEIQVPLLVNSKSANSTGQLPDKDDQMYHIAKDNLYLIPTSEVPVTNIYRNTLLNLKQLPIKMTSYTPCFRREAGSYGSDVRGLNRLHQFDKVEIVRIENPECSYDALDKMLNHVKKLLHSLELPYRILNLCGGDLGFTSAITYDFEIFSSAQNKWLEVSSVSNFETFQSIRLKLKYRDINGKNQFAHTLNGSSLALPRVMAGILENNQTNDSIKIPKVLIPYTDFKLIN